MRWIVPWLAASLLSLAGSARADPRRYALLVGANTGDAVDPPLRFAESDAAKMRDVLVNVGQIGPGDATLLMGATASSLEQALQGLRTRLAEQDPSQEQVLIYVSAHSDEAELHLSGTRFPLHELTQALEQLPVPVAILVIDSCRAGSATRLKGLEPIEGAQVSVLAHPLTGRVVIGSSGPDEYSQESDLLQGSFFTHHLIAGLRGAADASGDGLVTLQEAYSYAYALTVESTFATKGGVQHPSYRVDLQGQGDLVLSQPAHAKGRLRLQIDAPGEWLIYATSGHEVVAQFEKSAGPVLLAVAPGSYRVLAREGSGYRERAVVVPEGGEATVQESDLAPSAFNPGLAKGPSEWIVRGAILGSLGNGITSSVPTSIGVAVWGEVERPSGWLGPIRRLDLDLAGRSGTAEGSPEYREETLEVRGGPALGTSLWRFDLSVALCGGVAITYQNHLAAEASWVGFEPEAGIEPRGSLRLWGPLNLVAGVFLGGAEIRTEQGLSFRPRAEGQVGLGFIY